MISMSISRKRMFAIGFWFDFNFVFIFFISIFPFRRLKKKRRFWNVRSWNRSKLRNGEKNVEKYIVKSVARTFSCGEKEHSKPNICRIRRKDMRLPSTKHGIDKRRNACSNGCSPVHRVRQNLCQTMNGTRERIWQHQKKTYGFYVHVFSMSMFDFLVFVIFVCFRVLKICSLKGFWFTSHTLV